MTGQNLNNMVGMDIAGFILKELLGEGGTAVVYSADSKLDPSIKRAIKIIRPEFSEQKEFTSRFIEEARLLEKLYHPNIVRFHGIQRTQDFLILVLELLQGETLEQKMKEAPNNRVDKSLLLDWFIQAGNGLGEAHQYNIIHRDIKPENLFLTEVSYPDGTQKTVLKILDFGIAKALEDADRASSRTKMGTVTGTPAYMSPEACEDKTVRASADVYSLGISFIEMLLGHHPLSSPGKPRQSTTQLMLSHVKGEFPDLRSIRPDISPTLNKILKKAISKDPAARYANGKEFAEALSSLKSEATVSPEDVDLENKTRLNLPTLTPTQTEDEPAAEKPPTKSNTPLYALIAVILILGGLYFSGVLNSKQDGEPAKNAEKANPEAENQWLTIVIPQNAQQKQVIGLTKELYISKNANQRKLTEAGMEATFKKNKAIGLYPWCNRKFPEDHYQIQQHEVSWGELDPWLKQNPAFVFRIPNDKVVPPEINARKNLPVVDIPWKTALAYCESIGGYLPTEEQWEYAARGKNKRPYPWGTSLLDNTRTHVYQGNNPLLKAVMTSSQDVTAGEAKLYDMLGNAFEWTIDPFMPDNCKHSNDNWEANYRTYKGLPINQKSQAPPKESAAYRSFLCGTGSCLEAPIAEEYKNVSTYIGFRCIRPLPPEVRAKLKE